MNPGEQEALNEAKEKVAKIHRFFFDYAKDVARMDNTQLATMGQRKGNAEAVYSLFNKAEMDCRKVWAEFLKRFPDK